MSVRRTRAARSSLCLPRTYTLSVVLPLLCSSRQMCVQFQLRWIDAKTGIYKAPLKMAFRHSWELAASPNLLRSAVECEYTTVFCDDGGGASACQPLRSVGQDDVISSRMALRRQPVLSIGLATCCVHRRVGHRSLGQPRTRPLQLLRQCLLLLPRNHEVSLSGLFSPFTHRVSGNAVSFFLF